MSLARQNLAKTTEDALNAHINVELSASYVYQSMAAHFDRDDVALHGFRDFFAESSEEENEHAQKFIRYLNQRGGRVVLEGIARPQTAWESPLSALESALQLERVVNEKLLALHKTATENTDPQLCDFLETEYLKEQVEAIKKLADLITNLKRVGEGLGVYLFDKDLKKVDLK